MKVRNACAAVVAPSLCLALSSVAWAGIEPVPWQPQINQLNAVQNNLRSIHERVDRVLALPPDPYAPSPSAEGAVGRLGAMENQLLLLDRMLISVMDEVLSTPPDPYVPADLVPALEGVRAASQGIADSIDAYLASPPDPWVPAAFLGALSSTGLAAQGLADDAVHYLSGGGCPSGASCGCIGTAAPCAGFLEPLACSAQVGCYWSTAAELGCLGTPTPCSGIADSACGAQAGCRIGTCVDGTCQ